MSACTVCGCKQQLETPSESRFHRLRSQVSCKAPHNLGSERRGGTASMDEGKLRDLDLLPIRASGSRAT